MHGLDEDKGENSRCGPVKNNKKKISNEGKKESHL